jgi:TetR/AcrR family transcriptional regulator
MKRTVTRSRRLTETEARRRFILDAARRLIASGEVEEITMDAVAAAAGYTRRTMYAYFTSRDEILLRIFAEDLKARWSAQRTAIERRGTGLEKVAAWGRSFYAHARENPHSLRLQLYWDFRGVDRKRVGKETFAAFESVNEELADGLRSIFGLGVADGSLRSDLRTDLCISQYIYSLRAILNRAVSKSYSFASFEPDDYVEHFLDLFIRGIRREGDARP